MNLYNGLLTGGLGINLPATSTLITMQFHLFAIEVIVPVVPPIGAGSGGSYPMGPGEIKDFYKPIDTSKFPDPIDPTLFKNAIVTGEPKTIMDLVKIKVKMGDRLIEKEFAVPKKRVKMLVKAANFINSTRDKINVTISAVKRIKNNIKTRIFNFRSRSDK